MKVLITGHRGYIGAVMCKFMTAAGHEVTGLDSDLYLSAVNPRGPTEEPERGPS